MGLTFYTMARLRELGKAAIRALPQASDVNTADGSDFAMLIHAASVLFQGSQVAAQYVREQIFPATADANNRERMLAENAVDFTKAATKARGYILVGNKTTNLYDHQIKAGYTFEFPTTAFPDGIARTYVALEDAVFRSEVDHWVTGVAGIGQSIAKTRTRTISMRRGDTFARTSGGFIGAGIVRNADLASRHVDLFFPCAVAIADGDTVTEDTRRMLVKVECSEAGVAGNGASFFADPLDTANLHAIESSDPSITVGTVIEMSGGNDAVGEVDADNARVVRVLEDTIAGAPSGGNAQHWREIAMACPDVAVDDAIVYMGVRGQGSIDIVAIGHSGQVRASGFPDTNVGHLAHGTNRRRIGDVQAALVESWCKTDENGNPRTHYFDDVKVRSVEWDYRGRYENHYSTNAFLRSSNTLRIGVQALSGYGPDCGEYFSIVPYQMDPTSRWTRLYPAGATARVPASLKVGDRVSVIIQSPGYNAYPFAQVITKVVGFDYNRKFAIVDDMTSIAGMVMPRHGDATIMHWCSAGPLNQLVDNAVHEYFDALGPGSYTAAPIDPGTQATYAGSGVAMRPFAGIQVDRWPDEGRRWSGAFRKSALLSKVLGVKGVKGAAIITLDGNELVDMDPVPLQTLRLSGVWVSVSP